MKQPTAEAITHLRNRIHIIIEGTDTRLGKLFDIVLLIAILASVAVVMLDSVLYMRLQYGILFLYAEWFFTILFTIEYALRLFSAPNRLRYAFSFWYCRFIVGVTKLSKLDVCRRPVSAGDTCVAYLTCVSCPQTQSLYAASGIFGSALHQPTKNHCVFLIFGAVGDDFRLDHLCGRGQRMVLPVFRCPSIGRL